MKNEEIEQIINKTETDKLNIYLSLLLSKCKDIEKENNFIALIMILLVLLFYSASFGQLDSLKIGPISIKEINSIKIFIPLVFSFLIFRYLIINSHKAEIEKIVKIFSRDFFKIENNDIEKLDDFTRTILPISIYTEINNLTTKGKSKFGCFGAILIFPIVGIAIIPYTLQFIWLKDFLSNYDKYNFFQKSAIILSLWITILSLYYFIHSIIIKMKENL